jgi:soluble lytic murein transglycosylase-like protein
MGINCGKLEPCELNRDGTNGDYQSCGHNVAGVSREKRRSPNSPHVQITGAAMIRTLSITTILVTLSVSASPGFAQKQRLANLDANGNLDSLIARHAAANNLPEDLVRRVIKRESGGNPRVVSAGNYGLMQIKLATARAMGYGGTAAGLLDADTNMTYAVKYLAGAYHAANGNSNQAVHYYAAGYYYAAKRKGMAMPGDTQALNAYASEPMANVKFSSEQKLHSAMSNGESVASSSSLYTARLDYH